ncbi:chondroitin sulfate N-acetylgalactosaminyltransferase 1-like [Stigmatopora nigra]
MWKRWLLVRIAQLVSGFCCCAALLYLLACGPSFRDPRQALRWSSDTARKEGYVALLQKKEDLHKHYINTLEKKIAQLKEALQQMTIQFKESQEKAKTNRIPSLGLERLNNPPTPSELKEFFYSQLKHTEINSGISLPNEYVVIPFESFTLKRVYHLQAGAMQPEVKPIRKDHRNELTAGVETALHVLNGPQQHVDTSRMTHTFSPSDFIEGLTRNQRNRGTVYELIFKGDRPHNYVMTTLFKPFGPLVNVNSERVDVRSILVNIIVPLAKRLDTFRQFIQNFREVCIKEDDRIHLTVVYFGHDQFDQVKATLAQITRETNFRNITLIQLNEEFSSGRGLEVGAKAWRQSQDVLMFFCDVDIIFTSDFLTSCRLNAKRGKKVYYPILFSQYNPSIIYRNYTHVPSIQQQLIIGKDSGFWRVFGYGMTCQYKSDFFNVGGFGQNIKGWGMEDVLLYRKHVQSKLMVVRATSRSLFHMWHEKKCSGHLPLDRYQMCMGSKAMTEASQGQLGELLFQADIQAHLERHRKGSRAMARKA